MKPPCEIVVWYVIPAIRSELAKELLNLGSLGLLHGERQMKVQNLDLFQNT